jgi:CRISPR-associated exonuclease Cas4
LLVAETHGRRPPYGLVKYADAVFEVKYTLALERAVLDTLQQMRRDLARQRARRNHTDAARCASCGYRHACDECLAHDGNYQQSL